MDRRPGQAAGLLALWLALLLIALLTRPLIPVDETRYVAVAWEMWQRGDFLVPYLNGEPYAHKPPLFFWLIHLGWWLFGVSAWWPPLVGALASLGALFATAQLAGLLWPDDMTPRRQVAWILIAGVFWAAFYTWVQIDMLLVLACVLAMSGLVRAARGQTAGWWQTGLCLGLGMLAKGPVMLLLVLPAALLAPLWAPPRARRGWLAWYGGVGCSVLCGALVALAWALPAAQAGGEVYEEALLWEQTAKRIVQSFAHARPWWWYLPWLPVLLAPWVLLPWVWQGLRAAAGRPDAGWRFCLCWLLPPLLLLSLVSGKQVKYLLPLLPAAALLVARGLSCYPRQRVRQRLWLLAAVLFTAGLALAVIPGRVPAAPWVADIHPVWGAGVMALAAGLVALRPLDRDRYPAFMALVTACVVGLLQLGVFRPAAPAYDLRAVSRLIATAQAAGSPVANLAPYHGQFHYYGRLRQPLITPAAGQAVVWARTHPHGYLVAYYPGAAGESSQAEFVQRYRG
ncbi:MAG: glycosyltransferase family 39 protein, partial [Gammaproteobacteria bacterium]